MTKELSFCKMQFHDNYVTCIVNEGITFSIAESREQTREILNHFNNTPFVYITNRINSYSVDPAIYNSTSQIENLLGFAVVSKNDYALRNAEIEKLFLNKPFKSFKDLKDAKDWVHTMVNN